MKHFYATIFASFGSVFITILIERATGDAGWGLVTGFVIVAIVLLYLFWRWEFLK